MAIHFSSVSQLKSIFFISVQLGSPKSNFSFLQKKVFLFTLPQKLSIKCIISLHHHHRHPPTHSNLFMLCSHSFTCIIIAVILYTTPTTAYRIPFSILKIKTFLFNFPLIFSKNKISSTETLNTNFLHSAF